MNPQLRSLVGWLRDKRFKTPYEPPTTFVGRMANNKGDPYEPPTTFVGRMANNKGDPYEPSTTFVGRMAKGISGSKPLMNRQLRSLVGWRLRWLFWRAT